MSNVDQIRALTYGIQFSDPRLFELLRLIATEIETVNNELFPIVPAAGQASTAAVYVTPVDHIDYLLFSNFVQLFWDKPGNDVISYDLRLDGSDWNSADRILITQSTLVKIDPITTGSHTYRIKALNSSGDESAETTVSVIVPTIGAVAITASVIDNNVLLYWTAPTSVFTIDHYDLYRDSVFFGSISGTFTTLFETLAGTYNYKIIPVDITGSEGTPVSVDLLVNQPPDFVLEDEFVANLNPHPGTVAISNVILGRDRLLACIDDTITWFEHFDDNGYATIQDQLDAGYPLYIQPTETSGSYIEKVDFGVIISNIIATVDYNFRDIVGTVGVTVSIEYSDDDITWSGYTVGKQLFIPSLQYLRVKLEFAGNVGDLLEITNLRYILNVKQQVDSGSLDVYAADVGGTTVTFNLSFKDVNSITVTPNSTTYAAAIFDFADIPNPTTFAVLVYDSAGSRRDCNVSWKARGII